MERQKMKRVKKVEIKKTCGMFNSKKGYMYTLSLGLISLTILVLVLLFVQSSFALEERRIEFGLFNKYLELDDSIKGAYSEIFFRETSMNLTIDKNMIRIINNLPYNEELVNSFDNLNANIAKDFVNVKVSNNSFSNEYVLNAGNITYTTTNDGLKVSGDIQEINLIISGFSDLTDCTINANPGSITFNFVAGNCNYNGNVQDIQIDFLIDENEFSLDFTEELIINTNKIILSDLTVTSGDDINGVHLPINIFINDSKFKYEKNSNVNLYNSG
jgi:hypothetical protein